MGPVRLEELCVQPAMQHEGHGECFSSQHAGIAETTLMIDSLLKNQEESIRQKDRSPERAIGLHPDFVNLALKSQSADTKRSSQLNVISFSSMPYCESLLALDNAAR